MIRMTLPTRRLVAVAVARLVRRSDSVGLGFVMSSNESEQVAPILQILDGNLNFAAEVTPHHVSPGAISKIEPSATGSCNMVRNEPELNLLAVGKCDKTGLKTIGDRRRLNQRWITGAQLEFARIVPHSCKVHLDSGSEDKPGEAQCQQECEYDEFLHFPAERRVVAPAGGSPNSNWDVIAGCHARLVGRLILGHCWSG